MGAMRADRMDNGLRHRVWPFVLWACAVAFALAACGAHERPAADAAHKAHVDSVLSAITHTDSLAVMVNEFDHAGDRVGVMLASGKLGKSYRNSSRFEEAIAAHSRCLNLAWELRDTIEAVRALNNLGTDFRRLGIIDDATSYHYRALLCCEQYGDKSSEDARKNRVISLNGLGNIYMTLENYPAADSVLRAALEGEKSLGSALGQAINYANLGSIMEHYGRVDSAWVYYRKSLELNTEAGSDLGISLCHTHFGRLYENAGQYDRAIDEYRIAYDLMSRNSDVWHRLEACLAMAQVNIKQDNLAPAMRYVTLADSLASQINSLEHQAAVSDLLYQIADRQGNARQALSHYVRSRRLQDSLLNTQNVNRMHNLRLKYERDRSRNEINSISRLYDSERHEKNMLIVVAVLVLLLAAGAIGFLVYSLRMRARHQQLMAHMEEVRSNFFTNVTHEFRTPLTVIMGVAQEMGGVGQTDPKTVRSQAQTIARQGNHLLDLVNQLLDISKVQNAVGEPDWRSGDIVVFIEMVVDSYLELCRTKRIDISYASREQSVVMDFVPDYVKRVLSNLIANAVKFTPTYGQIMLTSRVDGSNLRITVADTGMGISPADLPHVFESFYQSKSNRTASVGTGLGLSLVRQMIHAMDGSIQVHSGLGEGTVFELAIPLKHGEDAWRPVEVPRDMPQDPVFVPQDEPDGPPADDVDTDGDSRPRILIVEDHSDVAGYIGNQLNNDYRVSYALNGREALDKAQISIPDLIVTDLMMPEMDGYELCRQVRASEVLCHIPIVVVTARASEADRIAGIAAGADAYLLKPFNSEELRVRIGKLLEQRRVLRSVFAKDYTDSDYNPNEPFASGDRKFLDRLIDIVNHEIESGSHGRIEIDHIASEMNMSTSQLRRKVLAITGLNTMSYVNQVRMSKAKHLLEEDTERPIGEVAELCGFYDMAHFSRMFKQQHGITPSQFRARLM